MSNQQHNTSVEYREIPGFPGYRVGNDGSVWSRLVQESRGHQRGWITVLGDIWRKMTMRSTTEGYHTVVLCDGKGKQKNARVHMLVLEAFIGPRPQGMVCRHFPDPDPTNNRVENLSWGTTKQNCQDKIVHGTSGRGKPPPSAKLNESQVIEIRRLAAETKHTFSELARRFGVERKAIRRLLSGEHWKHVEPRPALADQGST